MINFDKSVPVFAKSPNIKGSVKKLSVIADLIRGREAFDAMNCLKFCKKRGAVDVLRLLKSAISNAENNFGYDIDTLIVQEVFFNKDFTLKRLHARARGRGSQILKRYSTCYLYLGNDIL